MVLSLSEYLCDLTSLTRLPCPPYIPSANHLEACAALAAAAAITTKDMVPALTSEVRVRCKAHAPSPHLTQLYYLP